MGPTDLESPQQYLAMNDIDLRSLWAELDQFEAEVRGPAAGCRLSVYFVLTTVIHLCGSSIRKEKSYRIFGSK